VAYGQLMGVPMPTMHGRFRPSLAATLATVALLPILLALGLWQLDRAEQKRALEALYAARMHDDPVRIDHPIGDPATLRYRAVELEGRFDAARTVLLDNRVRRGRAGYEVLTPLQLTHSGLWVLINRGWVPQPYSRDQLPPIETPDEAVRLRGIIDLPPGKPLALGDDEPGSTVIQAVDLGDLSQRFGHELQPAVILLDPASGYGFERDWQVTPLGADRHSAYALQWFSLAAALVVLYIVAGRSRATSGIAS
jgi:surfeit locus 1 family protein